ncbi:transmembrane protein 260-like [Elysia marginata]|uniref:Transmembrane protein 260-like n=1 Tax=Elysia marginata TaxID=1093978 RepID=A0AAV4EKZ2_9GAST|nr:transmembrane protein 260-like [Elysia marginata]
MPLIDNQPETGKHPHIKLSQMDSNVWTCLFQQRNLPLCDNSTNTVVRDFALQSLAAFPNSSIILTKGDLPSNSFRYFHLCEGVRPDLTVFDQEVLTYPWSLPMTRKFYPAIHFPGGFLHLKKRVSSNGEKSFTFLDLINANYHRPLFACIGVQEYESSWKKGYDLWPYSVCWRFKKKVETLAIGQWSEETEHLADSWHYAQNSFEPGSWESVANDEMWRAKTATAMFYLDIALTLPEGSKEYFELLTHSYQLLSRALKQASYLSSTNSSDDVPGYWHRNFAIICERLVRSPVTENIKGLSSPESLPDQISLVRLTAHHFRQFLRQDPHDPDYAKIQEAVSALQTYLDNISEEKPTK